MWWLRLHVDNLVSKVPLEEAVISAPHWGTSAWSTRGRNRSSCAIWLWKSVGIMSSRGRWETATNTGACSLYGQLPNFVFSHSPWTPVEGKQLIMAWSHTRNGDVCVWGQDWKERQQGDCDEWISHTIHKIYLTWVDLHTALTWENVLAPHSWFPVSPAFQAPTLWRTLLALASLGLQCRHFWKAYKDIWDYWGFGRDAQK